MHQAIFAKRYWYFKAQNKHALSPIGHRPYFDISAPHVHNPVMTMIVETSEDDTQAYLNNSQHRSFVWNNAKSTLLTNKKKQRNLGVRFEPLLELSPPLESCSDIYVCPTSYLIVITLLFNVLFLQYFPLFYLPVLSIYSRSANIRPVHSNRALYHCKIPPLTADWLEVCFGI